jgi:N-methylhydantoinase A/oxoprolinase/acetone carboxylase beta subunit
MTGGYVVGVDIGGTFTDCVVVGDAGTMILGKACACGATVPVHASE